MRHRNWLKNFLFAGSYQGGRCAATVDSIIENAKLDKIEHHAWLRDVIIQPADHPQCRINELLPSNYQPT